MPSFDTLTELEYLYYSVGFFYFKEQQQNDKISMMETIINQSSKLIEYYTYELADIKFILFDISSSVRGIGGVKSCLKPSDLPSYEKHKEKTINDLISECNRLNIKILPLKINKSKWEFTVENGSIRVGFCAVKGIGKSMYETINTNRKIDIESFILNQNKIPKKILMILIASKAFNGTKKENLEKYNLIRNEQLDGTIKIGTNKSFNMFANERHVNKMIYGSDFMFKE
jgi:hypothetical protein